MEDWNRGDTGNGWNRGNAGNSRNRTQRKLNTETNINDS